jgi:hypothetical protein
MPGVRAPAVETPSGRPIDNPSSSWDSALEVSRKRWAQQPRRTLCSWLSSNFVPLAKWTVTPLSGSV